MIKIKCVCHYDKYKGASWPTSLACRPVVGDFIKPLSGQEPLMITEIIHCESNPRQVSALQYEREPLLELLLMTRNKVVPT